METRFTTTNNFLERARRRRKQLAVIARNEGNQLAGASMLLRRAVLADVS